MNDEFNYLTAFFDKERYQERYREEGEKGKGCFVAAMCPTCYRQSIVVDESGIWLTSPENPCVCDETDTVCATEIVAATAPPEWEIPNLRGARYPSNRW